MANKEILGLEIEVDSIELDKTEKKLRSLDKLLQQTQRRASVLGKTKIAPKISLDDRFSSAAEKIKRTLTQLQRAKVRPVVQLADHVSATVARITGSLIGMSTKPWRVAVEAVDWDAAIGGSFSNWMSAEGANNLQRISSSIGTALGSGLKDVMMGALGLAEPKQIPIRWGNLVEEDRKLLKDQNESPYTEAGKKAGEQFFQAFLGVMDSEQIANKLGEGSVASSKKEEKGPKWLGVVDDFVKDLTVSLLVEGLTKKLGGKFSSGGLFKELDKGLNTGTVKGATSPIKTSADNTKAGSKIAATFQKVKKGITTAVDGIKNFGEKLSSGLLKGVNTGKVKEVASSIKTPTPNVKVSSKAAKGLVKALPVVKGILGPAGLALSIYETQKYMDKTGVSEAVGEAPKKIWSGLNTPITEINGKSVKDMGYFEHWVELGKEAFNTFTSKEVWKNNFAQYKSTWNPLLKGENINSENKEKAGIKQNKANNEDIDFSKWNISNIINSYQNQKQSPNISITLPPGVVNYTVNKDKPDYDELSEVTAKKIADQLKMKLQNLE